MMTRRIAPMVGLALLAVASCIAPKEETARTDESLRVSTAEVLQDVRSSLNQLGAQIDRLDRRYSSATDDMAASWSNTRSDIREYRERLEAHLARLEGASADEAEELKREMAEDLERLTERLERAELQAVEGHQEFLSASHDRMVRLEDDLRALDDEVASLSAESRQEASDAVEELRERAGDLENRLNGLADATAEEIGRRRRDIAETFGALTASVRRKLFELRQGVIH